MGSRAKVTSPHSSSAKEVQREEDPGPIQQTSLVAFAWSLESRVDKCTEMIVPTLPGSSEVLMI